MAARQLPEEERPLLAFAPCPAGPRSSGARGAGQGRHGQWGAHRRAQVPQSRLRGATLPGAAPPLSLCPSAAYLPSRSQSYTSTLMVLWDKGSVLGWA